MAMNKLRATKKMKGFMCHSSASTAVCMSQDYRSVTVPCRSYHRALVDQVRMANSTKYIQLGEQPRAMAASVRGSVPISSLKKGQEEVRLPQEATAGSLAVSGNVFQVVVMRVSIHCQGCAGKVKKHISKMEGVTSFSIDVESKRVTVMGNVSPSGVLESMSKVKKAEFWPCSVLSRA